MDSNLKTKSNNVFPTIVKIEQYANAVYNDMKLKGFWNEQRNIRHIIALIISEVYEALEAHRAGKVANLKDYERASGGYENFVPERFEQTLKGTLGDELGDICIRVFDVMGGHEIQAVPMAAFNFTNSSDFVGCLLDINSILTRLDARLIMGTNTSVELSRHLTTTLKAVYQLAARFEIELAVFIQEKIKYNKTRPPKHGKKY